MISHQLKYEWDVLGINPTTLNEWYQIQINFLSNHEFFTDSALRMRKAGKQKNLDEIREICALKK